MHWLCCLGLVAACGRFDFDRTAADAPAARDATLLTYRDAVLADHPLGYWRLGDAGSQVHDETGGLDATFVGTCPATTGALAEDPDAATRFDSACTFSLGSGFQFLGTASFSIEVWFDTIDSASQTQFTIMSEQRMLTGGPDAGYAIVVDDQGIYGERAVAQVVANTSRTPLPAGFVHVVFTYDGAKSQMFVDGIGQPALADTRAVPAYTGELDIGGTPIVPAAFALGSLDELAVYDHALAQDRITLHRDLGVNGP